MAIGKKQKGSMAMFFLVMVALLIGCVTLLADAVGMIDLDRTFERGGSSSSELEWRLQTAKRIWPPLNDDGTSNFGDIFRSVIRFDGYKLGDGGWNHEGTAYCDITGCY